MPNLSYFKRFRMEADLRGRDYCGVRPPAGFRLVPWHDSLLEVHGETKYLSFAGEMDAEVFPCLGEMTGCQRLMNEIAHKPGFLPEATWLIACRSPDGVGSIYCGTIQGVCDRQGYGAVQNLGVLPEYRHRGLGTCLLLKALAGFQAAGLRRALLEVTAQNANAVKLYRRLGFARVKTVYKVAEVAYS